MWQQYLGIEEAGIVVAKVHQRCCGVDKSGPKMTIKIKKDYYWPSMIKIYTNYNKTISWMLSPWRHDLSTSKSFTPNNRILVIWCSISVHSKLKELEFLFDVLISLTTTRSLRILIHCPLRGNFLWNSLSFLLCVLATPFVDIKVNTRWPFSRCRLIRQIKERLATS